MAELVPCMDCKQPISSSAENCPKCGSKHPHGVSCALCYGARVNELDQFKHTHQIKAEYFSVKDALSRKDSEKILGSYIEYTYYYHSRCAEKLLTPPSGYTCSDCDTLFAQVWPVERILKLSWRDTTSCPNCGSQHFLRTSRFQDCCEFCRLPILRFHKEVTPGEDRYHIGCKPVWIEEEKERQAKRITEEAEQKRARHEEYRKQNIGEWVYSAMGSGGFLGFFVGFFMSCDTRHLQSIGFGAWFGTLLLGAIVGVVIGAVIGALIGLAVGNALES